MNRRHDRTLLARLGFQDPDKQDPRHDLACRYLTTPAVRARLAELLVRAEVGACDDEGEESFRSTDELTKEPWTQPFRYRRSLAISEDVSYQLAQPILRDYNDNRTPVGFLDVRLEFQYTIYKRGEVEERRRQDVECDVDLREWLRGLMARGPVVVPPEWYGGADRGAGQVQTVAVVERDGRFYAEVFYVDPDRVRRVVGPTRLPDGRHVATGAFSRAALPEELRSQYAPGFRGDFPIRQLPDNQCETLLPWSEFTERELLPWLGIKRQVEANTLVMVWEWVSEALRGRLPKVVHDWKARVEGEHLVLTLPTYACAQKERVVATPEDREVAVEVKTTPVPAGDILRQVKLYREYVEADAWVVATTFPLSAAERDVLAHEKIRTIRLGPEFDAYVAAALAAPPEPTPGVEETVL